MPLILLGFARTLVMALLSGAAVTAVSSLFDTATNKLVDYLKTEYGFTDDDAVIVVANTFLDVVIASATLFALLKLKIPAKTADRLGFTTKGYTKRAVSQQGSQLLTKLSQDTSLSAQQKFLQQASKLVTFVGLPVWTLGLIQQFLDQGVFGAANANRILEASGLPFRWPTADVRESPPPFTGSSFKDYAIALESQGVTGINNPFVGQSQIYNRIALAELVFAVYGKAAVNGEKLSETKIIPELAKYLIIPGRSVPATIYPTSTPSKTPSVPSIKVFTGALGGGTLSNASSFTPRPDDLIESMDELNIALRNNLVPFLASVVGRFVYETKVVTSVTTRDGFTQRGQAQQVVSGYNKDGSPKYRTVVNKFAVADIYFLGETGTRSKATRIVLGPTDAVKFRPSQGELGKLDLDTKGSISTSSLSDVSDVTTGGTKTTLQKPTEQPLATQSFSKAPSLVLSRLFRAGAANTTPQPDQIYADTGKRIYLVPNLAAVGAGIYESTSEYVALQEKGQHYSTVRSRLKERYGIDFDALPARNIADLEQQAILAGYETQEQFDPGRGNVKNPIYTLASVNELVSRLGGAATSQPIGAGPACEAETLKAFFNARGEELPPVEVRSVLYEQFGLGSRNFYTANTDQNIKLLAKLKAQAGCPI